MDVSDEVKTSAFARCGGRCECQRTVHRHPAGRCTNILSFDKAHFLPIDGKTVAHENDVEVACYYCMISLEAAHPKHT